MLLNVAPLLLNCHLLGKTSTKETNVIFVPIGYSESTAVLPAGRKIGRITQKEPRNWPYKSTAEFWPDISRKGQKGAFLIYSFVPLTFPIVIALIN
jgi:hypothetical protein